MGPREPILMGRAVPAAQRMGSQRPPREERSADLNPGLPNIVELSVEQKLNRAQSDAAYWHREYTKIKTEYDDLKPPSLVGLQSEIPKLKEGSDAFYSHVDFGVSGSSALTPLTFHSSVQRCSGRLGGSVMVQMATRFAYRRS